MIGSAVTLGIYMRGINEDSPLQDCFEALLRMNDNDIMEAQRYKQKNSGSLMRMNFPESSYLLKSTASVCWMKVTALFTIMIV